MNVYSALVAELHGLKTKDLHVTLTFCSVKKTPRIYLDQESTKTSYSHIVDVQYWKHVDLTVLIVKPNSHLQERHDYYVNELGLTYDYDFVPHITVDKGNKVNEYFNLIGEAVMLSKEYLKFVG